MLIQFKVKNFRSIREEQTLSMVASNYEKDLPGNTIAPELPGMRDIRLLKGAALHGANASGKSNLLDALRFVVEFVRNSATRMQPDQWIDAAPFKLDDVSGSSHSRFELEFALHGIRYSYALSVTQKRVLEEKLLAYPKGRPQVWCDRIYNQESGEYRWGKVAEAFKKDETLEKKTRANSLFVSVAAVFNHVQIGEVFKWFGEAPLFLNVANDSTFWADYTAHLMKGDEGLRRKVIELMRSADLGIVDVDAREEDLPIAADGVAGAKRTPPVENNYWGAGHWGTAHWGSFSGRLASSSYRVQMLHLCRGSEPVPFDLDKDESAGTRKFFSLLGPWLIAMNAGRILFVDEIESSLHPLLAKELVHLIFSSSSASSPPQLIFTTHNPFLLNRDLLRRDQIWFTEKDECGATHLYPLTDFKPRKDEAIARGYLAGRYGGIPYIPGGLER